MKKKKILAAAFAALLLISSACAPASDSASGASSADDSALSAASSTSDGPLADGDYLPDDFTFSGGSGKVKIACTKVSVSGGESTARIVFSSEHYSRVLIDDVEYSPEVGDETSTFEIPVALNEEMEITGTTTAMSEPHDIDYTICVYLNASTATEYSKDAADALLEEAFAQDETGTSESSSSKSSADSTPPEIEGLTYESSMELKYATGFAVHYYSDDFKIIDVIGSRQYLIVPEGAQTPENLDDGIVVIQNPLENVFMSASAVMSLFDALDALDTISFSSREAKDWYIENAAAAMQAGDIVYAGKYSEPDYEMLLGGDCDLAIESTMIFHAPEVQEMIESLGIPVFIDRSSYEENPLGRTEWIKVYGAMLGKEEQAESFIEAQAEKVASAEMSGTSLGTVAFFHVDENGAVVVRNADDYIARMIEMGGGDYIYDESIGGSDSAKVTVTIEDFYDTAGEADYLIYNTSIASPLQSIDELVSLNEVFADFKAVKNGNVWTANERLYQATDGIADFIAEVNGMLSGSTEDMQFLSKLNE